MAARAARVARPRSARTCRLLAGEAELVVRPVLAVLAAVTALGRLTAWTRDPSLLALQVGPEVTARRVRMGRLVLTIFLLGQVGAAAECLPLTSAPLGRRVEAVAVSSRTALAVLQAVRQVALRAAQAVQAAQRELLTPQRSRVAQAEAVPVAVTPTALSAQAASAVCRVAAAVVVQESCRVRPHQALAVPVVPGRSW